MRLSPTGLHFRPREGSWTVGGRGGPGLTQGRRTENHSVPQLISRLAVRVGNPSHSYHPGGFYTGARSPAGGREGGREGGTEGGREGGGGEGGTEGGRDGGRDGRREGGREGGRHNRRRWSKRGRVADQIQSDA